MISISYQETSQGTIMVADVSSANKMEMNCSLDDFQKSLALYKQGRLIQNAFPYLSADEREFLLSGMLPGEYDDICQWAEENME